jgi:hypothetical protein
MKNIEIKITDKKTKNIGFVVYGLSPNTGGNSKSAVEGGLNPPSSASNIATQLSKCSLLQISNLKICKPKGEFGYGRNPIRYYWIERNPTKFISAPTPIRHGFSDFSRVRIEAILNI